MTENDIRDKIFGTEERKPELDAVEFKDGTYIRYKNRIYKIVEDEEKGE